MESNDRRIGRVDDQTAKRISSGQVITSLKNVVKELLENAIDAKATVIAIRLKEMGKESIEVSDNGFGIAERDFTVLAQRHCTSKLIDFEELSSISSFGFRGEALNSLCLLADVSIQTRHSTDSVGTKLKFDSEARLIRSQKMALNVGTTVSVCNLFRDTPVRRKDFYDNLKREFDKMVRLVYGYCVGSIGLRIILTNQMTNKPKQTVLSSPGLSIRNNIIEVFDIKQSNCIIEFKSKLEKDVQNCDKNIEIYGLVSKCDSGCGRSASDRQYFYVNQRPCDMKNVQKFINDIYRLFNKNQFPFIVLNIKMDKNCVDFNLSPDKRQLLIANEDKLFKLIRECLEKVFNKEDGCSVNSMTNYLTNDNHSQPKSRHINDINQTNDREVSELMASEQNISSTFKPIRCRSPCDSPFSETTNRDVITTTPPLERRRDLCETSYTTARKVMNRSLFDDEASEESERKRTAKRKKRNSPLNESFEERNEEIPVIVRDLPFNSRDVRILSNTRTEERSQTRLDDTIDDNSQHLSQRLTTQITYATQEISSNGSDVRTTENETEANNQSNEETDVQYIEFSDDCGDIAVNLDTNQIESLFIKSLEGNVTKDEHRFSAKIRASQNEKAEQELMHELDKNDFDQMKIIGQFNDGFIVTKLGSNLFIVDQHASDERYNYERLLTNTVVENQKLVVPMPLELSAANEMVVIDNKELFKRLGFGIVIDQNQRPGHKIHLSSIPISKDWTAGKEDIEEIVGQLIDTPADLMIDYKLNAFKQVIASRACRSSVMIGDSLSRSQMKTIVGHMSQLQNPWHCAHNRPTIRHLVGLEEISSLSNN